MVRPANWIYEYDARDFRGGLNMRGDIFNLTPDESPDMLNVDVGVRGGFRQRQGVFPFTSTAITGNIQTLFEYSSTSGAAQVLASDGSNVWRSTGGTFTSIFAMTGAVHGSTFKDRLYCVNGTTANRRWDGSASVLLGTTFNDDLESPTAPASTGNMPIAKLTATHGGSVWVANTTEDALAYPSRVRFSHPNFAEDWRTEDFFDVDPGVDGDEITALVPFADRLLVFKKRSIHAIYGSDPETYQTFPVSREVGAISQEAVATTDLGIYFFDWPNGVYLYDGKDVVFQFERIFPAIQDGKIAAAYSGNIMLGWGNRRLWVSVPWMGSAVRSRVFVLDPTLTKKGSWVQYDLGVGPFVEHAPPGEDSFFLAADVLTRRVLRVDVNSAYDVFDTTAVPILTSYRTAWIVPGGQATTKVWKRPDVILRGGSTAAVVVNAYHDWDATFAKRHFTLNVAADGATSTVTTDPTGATSGEGWGTSTWGVSLWGRGNTTAAPDEIVTDGRNELHRGSPLGRSKAVSLEFIGPITTDTWGVESVALKYQLRRLRS